MKLGNVPSEDPFLFSLPPFLPLSLPSLSSLFLSFENSPKRPPGTHMLWKPSPTDRSRGKTVSNPFHLPALPLTLTQAPGEGGPTRPSGGWRGGRKEVLRMSYWERRTSLLRCTFLCHLKSGRKENAAGGEEKGRT